MSGGYAIEFAIVSELFIVTPYLVVVAPFLNEKFTTLAPLITRMYMLNVTFNRFKGMLTSLIVDCELVLRC